MIRLSNAAPVPFDGWVRTTTDQPIPPACVVSGTTIVRGRQIGADVHAIDVRVSLAARERHTFDLAHAVPTTWTLPPLPADPLAHFGGPATIGGQPAEVVSLAADGAGYAVHLRARVGRMLVCNVWLLWYPDTPGWATGEALVVASNPGVPDMGETVPAGLRLQFGDALTVVVGNAGGPLVEAGTVLADGQGKAVPIMCLWPRHMKPRDWESFGAIASLGLGAVGCTRLLITGAPLMPVSFSGHAWANERFAETIRRLHTFGPPTCGPALNSGGAGEQEDQLFHAGGEALMPDGAGAEMVRLWSALKLHAERPCNHYEVDGTPLDTARHSNLLFWDGRPHWHTGVSPDRLGKPRGLTVAEAHGRWGPDVQHTYQRSLVAAARLTGSRCAQHLLRNLATVYLLQRTAHPSWSTSAWESAREWGCEGQFVQDCYLDLEDRAMALRVVQRWRDRVNGILIPRMAGQDLLKVWTNDPRVNPIGQGAQWWQESFASWSIDETCRLVGPLEGREVGQRIARKVLDVAWQWVAGSGLTDEQQGARRFVDEELQAIFEASESGVDSLGPRWRSQPQGPIDGSANDANPASDGFNHYGMPLCVAVVLRVEPTHAKARAIWTQLLAATGEKARRWMPAIEGVLPA